MFHNDDDQDVNCKCCSDLVAIEIAEYLEDHNDTAPLTHKIGE